MKSVYHLLAKIATTQVPMHFGPCCANRAAMLRESIFIQCEFERTAALLIQLWKVFDRSKGHICAIYLEKADNFILAKISTIF